MGSYTELRINGFELLSTKSFVDRQAMTVFAEADKHVELVLVNEDGSQQTLGPYTGVDLEPPEDDQQIAIRYRLRARDAADRLDIMGITPELVRSVYVDGVSGYLAELTEWSRDESSANLWQDDIRALQILSFDRWCEEFAHIVRSGLGRWTLLLKEEESSPASDLGRFILGDHHGLWLGIPTEDPRVVLRAAIVALGGDAVVEQDITEVVHGGYYDIATAVAAEARQSLLEDYPLVAPLVVLTEGSTDGWILRDALQVVYPHLVGYIDFMDFEGTRLQGGAAALVATVKAFAGARIANRLVALFDNDTAARVAMRGLATVQLPPNIRVMQLPDLPLGDSYPTIGPSGLIAARVNGLAGSLELYLGADVLRNPDGNLMPVQWRGYDVALGQYHGELLDKAALHQRYRAKVALSSDTSLLQSQDWAALRLVLDAIRASFDTVPSDFS